MKYLLLLLLGAVVIYSFWVLALYPMYSQLVMIR